MTAARRGSNEAPRPQPADMRHVTLTNRRILELYHALTALDGRTDVRSGHVVTIPYRIGGQTRLAIARNKVALRTVRDAVEEAQNGLLLELSGGTGVLMPTVRDDASRDTPNPMCAEYHRRVLDLMNTTAELDLIPIDIGDILPENGDTENEIPPSVIEHMDVILTRG